MENNVGSLDEAQCLDCKQIGVAGSSSNQEDPALLVSRFVERGHRHLA